MKKFNRRIKDRNSNIPSNLNKKRNSDNYFIPFLLLVKKHLKINLRNKGAFIMLFAFPLILMTVYSIAFNSQGELGQDIVFHITIFNLDNIDENGQIISNDDVLRANSSAILLDLFNPDSNLTDSYENNAAFGNFSMNFAEIFINHQTHENGSIITQSDAIELIKDYKLDALIIIPQNFSEDIIGNTWWFEALGEGIDNLPNNISDYNDAGDLLNELENSFDISFSITTRLVIEDQLDEFFVSEDYDGLLEFIEYTNNTNSDIPQLSITTSIDPIEKEAIPSIFDQIVNQMVLTYNNISSPVINFETGNSLELTFFEQVAPSLLIVGVLVTLTLASFTLSQERGTRMLNRLESTPVPKSIQLLSNASGQLLLSIVQIVVLMVSIALLGAYIHPQARWDLIFITMVAFSIPCIGIGLIISSIFKTHDVALLSSTLLSVFFSVLDGWFYPMGAAENLVPNSYASDALTKIMIKGAGIGSIALDLVIVLIYGVITVSIGTILFSKNDQF